MNQEGPVVGMPLSKENGFWLEITKEIENDLFDLRKRLDPVMKSVEKTEEKASLNYSPLCNRLVKLHELVLDIKNSINY